MAALPFPDFKDSIELIKKGATVEAQEKIMELREYIIALKEENIELRDKISKLESTGNVKQNLEFRDGRYYLKKEEGVEEGPYCQRCWDADEKLIRLQFKTDANSVYNIWLCAECENLVKD